MSEGLFLPRPPLEGNSKAPPDSELKKKHDFLRAGGGRVGGGEGEIHTEIPALILGMRVDRGGGRLDVKTVSLHCRILDFLF